MDAQTQQVLQAGLKTSTKITYNAMQRQYFKFCSDYSLEALPAQELTVLRYLTFLSNKPGRRNPGLASSTLKLHLSAIRSLHVYNGIKNIPFLQSPRIALFIRSILHSQKAPLQKQPMDFSLLARVWQLIPATYNGLVLKASLVLLFFMCLRGCEMSSVTIKGIVIYPPPMLKAIAFGNHKGKKYLTYTVPTSKTRPHGFTRISGCSGSPICLPCVFWEYLCTRAHFASSFPDSPLLVWESGQEVSKANMNWQIKSLVKRLGLDPDCYSTHSVRSGAVSEGSSKLPPWLLQKMGGWKSGVYSSYIRNTGVQSMGVAAKLVKK